ncbi:MAG: ABC transporter substrate-binding protein, partial [Nitrosopumilaceae archaeon]
MKLLLVILFGMLSIQIASADKGTFVDEIQFIQYLDENTALEEVRNGNLDLYYYRISSDRIDSVKSREGLQVYESTGGSYSILIN